MKTLVSCITLGLIVWSASAQQIQPYPNYSGSGQARPSTGFSISPYPNQNQYPSNRQPNYNNRFPNQQGQNYNTGGYGNYGNANNNKFGNNNRFPNQNGQFGNNNRFPSQTSRPTGNSNRFSSPAGQTTRNYGNSSARVVVPWWFTGQFNTALPHIRQQRPMPNGYGNNYNQGGNQFPQPQYNNRYGNQNGNYGRPQTGYQRPTNQRPTYGSGYNNPYNNGQRYRAMPSQVGLGVQPRVLR